MAGRNRASNSVLKRILAGLIWILAASRNPLVRVWLALLGVCLAGSAWGQDLQIAGKISFTSLRDGNYEVYTMNADGSSQINLTNNSAEDWSASWSPDGAKLAFWSKRDVTPSIYTMNIDGSGVVRLTSSGDFNPVWSPDGSKIAFLSSRHDANGDIYVMNADGSSVTRLTSSSAPDNLPRWSPDGTRIAFWSERDGNREIYLMNVDGSNQTNLTNNPATDGSFSWSPDGSKIAYASNQDGNFEIYTINADGTNKVRVTNNSGADNQPEWSPDGTKIAFDTDRDGNHEVYLMNADGANQARLTNSSGPDYQPYWSIPQRIGSTSGASVSHTMTIQNTGSATLNVSNITSSDGQFSINPTNFSVSPGGNQSVTVTFAPTSAGTKYSTLTITSNDLDAPTAKLMVNGTATAAPVPVFSFSAGSLSTNTRIAFYTGRDGNTEVYAMDPDGTNPTRLTNNPANDGNSTGAWSPDGTKIAFNSNRDGNVEIYTMNADGTNPIRLTANSTYESTPLWSPDGTKIAFYSDRDGNGEVYVMNTDGTSQVRLTNNAVTDVPESWSPDGSKISFYSERDGNRNVYVMNSDGTNQTRLTSNATFDANSSWSPDGTKLAFQSDRDGNHELYVMNSDGTNQTRLTNNSSGDNSPSWAPDGTKIAFYSDRDGPNPQIYVMNTDGTNQTRITPNTAGEGVPSWSPFFRTLNLGTVTTGFSGTTTFTVTNRGYGTLSVSGISTAGTDAAQFSASPASFNLSAGQSQTVTVTFSPSSAGAKSASLSITHNAGGNPATVSLSGTGTAPANTAPTISNIADQMTNEDVPTSAVSFTVGDAETATSSLTLSATSSNTTLVPNANIALGGSGASRIVTVTPAANQSGSTAITVTVTDGGGLTASDSFTLTVNPVNDAPTLSAIANPAAISEDAGIQTLSLSGIGAGGGESQTLSVSATSANTALIPNPTVSYTSANTTGSLSYTPAANANGSATITVTTTDDGGTANGGVNTVSQTFIITVNPINDPPTLADLANQTITEDAGPQTLALTTGPGGGSDEAGQSVTLSATSSNPVVIPNPTVSGTTHSYTPVANQSGSATITVTATDGQAANHTTTKTFTVTVTPINDPPVLAPIGARTVNEGELLTFTLSGSDADGDALTYSATPLPTGAVLSGSTFSWTPTFEQAGSYNPTFTVSDGKGGTANEPVTITVNNATPPVWTPSPLTWNFGDVPAGTRAERTFYLKNPGTQAARIDSLVGSSAAFAVISPTFPRTVNGKDSLAVSMRFTPTPGVLTVQEGTLRLYSSLGTAAVPLAGRGVWVGFAVSSLELDFGRVRPNNSTSRTLIVTNGGNLKLEITSTTMSNPVFSVSPRTFSVEGGSSREVTVTFSPTQGRQEEGTLTLSGNADSTRVVRLQGQGGEGPSLVTVPTSLNFGAVRVDSARVGLLRLKNGGGDTLRISALAGLEPPFSVSPTQVPPLLANDSTQVRVRFAPTAKGNFSDALLVSLSDGSQQQVTISGRGVRPEPSLPNRLDFGRVAVGSVGELNLVVTNVGDDTLRVTNALSDKPRVFTVTGTLPLVVAPSGVQSLVVRFNPQVAGKDSSELTLSTNAGLPQRVRLLGTGEDAITTDVVVRLIPAEFGNVKVGEKKTARLIALNRGQRNVTLDSLLLAPRGIPVRIASGSLPRTLRQGDSVEVASVEFAPTQAGALSGSLRVKGRGVEQTLTLSGTGTPAVARPPALSYTSADTLRFGVLGANQSELQSLELRNNGSDTLKIVLRSEGEEFVPQAQDTLRIAGGQGYSALIRFTPSRTGTRRANLLIWSNDPQQPLTSLVMQGGGGGLYFDPPSIVFGEVKMGGRKDTTVTLVNQTANALTVRLSLPAGDFSVDRTSARIDAGKSLTLRLSFRPSRTGPRSARLSVQGRNLALDLAGVGVEEASVPEGGLQVSATDLNMGNTRVRQTSRKTLTLTNTSTQSITVSLALSGPNANQFRLTPTRLTLNPGQRRSLSVAFTPTSTGTKQATLTLTPATGTPLTLSLSGTAIATSRSLTAQGGAAKPAGEEWLNLALGDNYPNPFNAQTLIPYQLAQAGSVRLGIYDVLGRQVKILVDGVQEAGRYQVRWNSRNEAGEEVSSGIYFYRIEIGPFRAARKLLLVR